MGRVEGSSEYGTLLGQGVGSSGISVLSPALPHLTLQLLKKIKRCERKGTESVTEEKCAVLFSTSFTLGPNKLPIQLQVNRTPIPAQSGASGPLHTTQWGPGFSLLPHDSPTPYVSETHTPLGQGE